MILRRLQHILRALHDEESGQVTILFVFASIGFILMLGLILNTAQQTSRKIQMQNAADSAAVVGATWMARGMNLMAFNNKGMADIIGVMIDVHAVRQAALAMPEAIAAVAEGLYAVPFCIPCYALASELLREAAVFWIPEFLLLTETIDNELSGVSGVGWQLLGALDDLNVVIARAVPPIAVADAAYYGHRNGLPYAIGIFPLRGFPVLRGGKERLVIHANNEDFDNPACCLRVLKPATLVAVGGLCLASAAFPCVSFPLFIPLFFGALAINIRSLEDGVSPAQFFQYKKDDIGNLEDNQGQTFQDILNQYNKQNDKGDGKFKPINLGDIAGKIKGVNLGFGPLEWPNSPPLPMMLTDTGDPGDKLDGPPSPVDLLLVRRRLQYLAGTWAPHQRNGVIGGAKFVNPAPYGWLTYAQADVYNPVKWDMFQQQWRARLARASNLDEDWKDITSGLSIPISGLLDSSFLNNH